MRKFSEKQLDQMEKKLLKSAQAKEMDVELAEEFLMADLYSGYPPATEEQTDDN